MAQRNTYREDEELEEQINFRDILRVGKYLKPYMAQVARILVVVISMSCIVVAVPYLTKIMIDEAIPNKDLGKLGILAVILAALIVLYEVSLLLARIVLAGRIKKQNEELAKEEGAAQAAAPKTKKLKAVKRK